MDEQHEGGQADLMHVFDHELRTPLAALRGHLELVGDQAPLLPPSVLFSLEVMGRAVARIEAAVDNAAVLEESSRVLRSVG